MLTAHRSIPTTRDITWQHVPSAPPAPPQQLPPIAEEGESTAREGASGEDASNQGGRGVKDFYSVSDLNMTEVWPLVPLATREAPAAEPRARAGEGAEGNPPTPSVSPGRADFGDVNGSSSSSSSSDDSRSSSYSSNSNDNGDLPALVGRPARDLEVFGELPTAKRTHEVLVAGLDHESVLHGCPAGVCHEGRESQMDRGGGGNRTSSQFTAGRTPGEGA